MRATFARAPVPLTVAGWTTVTALYTREQILHTSRCDFWLPWL